MHRVPRPETGLLATRGLEGGIRDKVYGDGAPWS